MSAHLQSGARWMPAALIPVGRRWLPQLPYWAGGAGLVIVAIAYAQQRGGHDGTVLFWLGLAVAVAPTAVRCAGEAATRPERVALLLALSFVLYLVKALHDPLSPTAHDELVSYRSTRDVLLSGRLYQTNPIVSAYSDYPGLHILTSQLTQLSGAPLWTCALIIIGIARLLMTAALFALLERLVSVRAASIGVLFYIANPGYLLFDARFAYESLALPLAIVVLALLVRRDAERRDAPAVISALSVAAAVTVTHHASSVFLAATLVAWAVLSVRLKGGPRLPAKAWLLPPLFTIVYLLTVSGGAVVHELGPVFHRIVNSVSDLLTGRSGTKPAFGGAPGQRPVSALEKAVGFGSVAIALSVLTFGAWRMRRAQSAISAVLILLGLLYPVTLALRLTQAGSETSNRASEYVFLGLALVSGAAIIGASSKIGPLQRMASKPLVVGSVVTLMFAGGVVIGNSWYSRLPGRYLVAADPRSIDSQSRAVASWADRELAPRQRWLADRENALTVTAFGRQNVMTGSVGPVPVPDLFFSRPTGGRLPASAQTVIDGKAARYVLTDRRLATGLPVDGYYYETNEPSANRHIKPISLAALDKFDHIPTFDRAYDGGAIVVYRKR
jgi:hypothetical protein